MPQTASIRSSGPLLCLVFAARELGWPGGSPGGSLRRMSDVAVAVLDADLGDGLALVVGLERARRHVGQPHLPGRPDLGQRVMGRIDVNLDFRLAVVCHRPSASAAAPWLATGAEASGRPLVAGRRLQGDQAVRGPSGRKVWPLGVITADIGYSMTRSHASQADAVSHAILP
jgi:hypothetical protein